jgi:hypothetical protein
MLQHEVHRVAENVAAPAAWRAHDDDLAVAARGLVDDRAARAARTDEALDEVDAVQLCDRGGGVERHVGSLLLLRQRRVER